MQTLEHSETIIIELTYTPAQIGHAPVWTADEIAAWYAVAKDISEKAREENHGE